MTYHKPNNTPPESIAIIGGGGHALVVAEAAAMQNVRIDGFFDDIIAAHIARTRSPLGPITHLGTLNELERLANRAWIVAIGDPHIRRRVLQDLSMFGHGEPATIIHPRAFVSHSAVIGRGVYIGPNAIIQAQATVQDHAVINSGAIIEHDAQIGENAHIAPGCVLGGGVIVGPDALVGLGSRVLPRLSIGARSVVGAGAMVTRSVNDGSTVVGVPARESVRTARV